MGGALLSVRERGTVLKTGKAGSLQARRVFLEPVNICAEASDLADFLNRESGTYKSLQLE
jgi:hypothetical protein